MDAGEIALEAAMRELKEETGIDLKGEEELSPLIPAPDAEPVNTYTVGKGPQKKTVRFTSLLEHQGPNKRVT